MMRYWKIRVLIGCNDVPYTFLWDVKGPYSSPLVLLGRVRGWVRLALKKANVRGRSRPHSLSVDVERHCTPAGVHFRDREEAWDTPPQPEVAS